MVGKHPITQRRDVNLPKTATDPHEEDHGGLFDQGIKGCPYGILYRLSSPKVLAIGEFDVHGNTSFERTGED